MHALFNQMINELRENRAIDASIGIHRRHQVRNYTGKLQFIGWHRCAPLYCMSRANARPTDQSLRAAAIVVAVSKCRRKRTAYPLATRTFPIRLRSTLVPASSTLPSPFNATP